jgi:hypothetical protein
MSAKPSRPRRAIDSVPACQDCGGERLVARLSMLVGLNRRHPVAGMEAGLVELGRWHGPDQLVAVCAGCLSMHVVTRDLAH